MFGHSLPPRRWLLAGAGLVLVVVLGGVAFIQFRSGPDPAGAAAPDPAAAAPTGSAGSGTGPGGNSTDPAVPGGSTTGPGRGTATTPAKTPICVVADAPATDPQGGITVAVRTKAEQKTCGGGRVRVFWASYTRTANGGGKIYRTQVSYLDKAHPSWTAAIDTAGQCGDSWYVVTGNVGIPSTVKPGVTPFGPAKVRWDPPDRC